MGDRRAELRKRKWVLSADTGLARAVQSPGSQASLTLTEMKHLYFRSWEMCVVLDFLCHMKPWGFPEAHLTDGNTSIAPG